MKSFRFKLGIVSLISGAIVSVLPLLTVIPVEIFSQALGFCLECHDDTKTSLVLQLARIFPPMIYGISGVTLILTGVAIMSFDSQRL